MRQRPEIQEVLRGGDCTAADAAPVRNLHGVLRWVGGREYPGARDEARSALPFPRRRLLHDLRAKTGRALPQLRLRLVDARQPVSGGIPTGPAGRHGSADPLARAPGVHPVLGGARSRRAPARLDARVQQPHGRAVLLRAARRAVRFRPAGVPAGDAAQGRERRETVVAGENAMGTESHYHSKKDRIFVRALQGQYSLREELTRLRAMPRVRKGKELRFVDGPQTYSRHYVEPKDGITQMFHLHLEEYAPGGRSQKHGHVNEAAFYILDGKGYEVHDGVRYDWQAGDVAIVHNNCVHQHFNASPDKPARALVIKTKPMYMFMNLLFQQLVEPRPAEPAPGAEGYRVRETEE